MTYYNGFRQKVVLSKEKEQQEVKIKISHEKRKTYYTFVVVFCLIDKIKMISQLQIKITRTTKSFGRS